MNVNPSGTVNFKVVLLGEGCVGKSSLLLRYIEDKFNERHMSTLQCEILGLRYSEKKEVPTRLPNNRTPMHLPAAKLPLARAPSNSSLFDDPPYVLPSGYVLIELRVATFMNKRLNINGQRLNMSIWDTAGQEKFHALGPIYYRNSNGAILVYDITDEESFEKVRNWVKELKTMLGANLVLMIAGNKVDLESQRTVTIEKAEGYARAVGARHYHTSAKHNVGVEELFVDLARELVDRFEQGPSSDDESRTSRVIVVEDEEPVRTSCCGMIRR